MSVNKLTLYNVDIDELNGFVLERNISCDFRDFDGVIFVSFASENNVDEFIEKFKDNIYAYEHVSLITRFTELVKKSEIKLSVAESFTGGGLSCAITSISGASSYFYEGQVTYDSRAKHGRLNVSEKTLEIYKPVSEQVANEMCLGLLENGDINFAISTTGIAGPNSDDSAFPVGLCYIGVGKRDNIQVFKHNFTGSRVEIMKCGINAALFHSIKYLSKL